MLTDTGEPKKTAENPIRAKANHIGKHAPKTNNSSYIEINGENTHIPVNLPTAIIGDKGSGKTTMLLSIMESTHEHNIFNHIYFIFSPLTWDLELPAYIHKINISDAEQFLSTYFEIKSIFNSYLKFFKSLNFPVLMKKANKGKLTEEDILQHTDNNIVKYNKKVFDGQVDPNIKITKIVDVGEKLIKKFSQPFYINTIKVDGLRDNERDLIIIDDIATASKMLFKKATDDYLYEYFTLTRHMRLCVVLAGQQVEQIPKKLRREIMCWLLSKNTTLSLLDGVIQKEAIAEITKKQQQLSKYEFVAYNKMDGEIAII